MAPRHYGQSLCTKSLLSNYKNNIIDARDFGMKQLSSTAQWRPIQTTRPIIDYRFKVEDYNSVEIGGESGGGHRGTVGVGGAWPYKSYTTVTALLLIFRSRTIRTHGRKIRATSTTIIQARGRRHNAGNKLRVYERTLVYLGKAIPIALHAQITAVSSDGLTLTLSKAAAVTQRMPMYTSTIRTCSTNSALIRVQMSFQRRPRISTGSQFGSSHTGYHYTEPAGIMRSVNPLI